MGKSVTVVKTIELHRLSFATILFRLYKSAGAQDALKVGQGKMLLESQDIGFLINGSSL